MRAAFYTMNIAKFMSSQHLHYGPRVLLILLGSMHMKAPKALTLLTRLRFVLCSLITSQATLAHPAFHIHSFLSHLYADATPCIPRFCIATLLGRYISWCSSLVEPCAPYFDSKVLYSNYPWKIWPRAQTLEDMTSVGCSFSRAGGPICRDASCSICCSACINEG